MKCLITIEMDNTAFADDPGAELARVLFDAHSRVHNVERGKLRELNHGRREVVMSLFDLHGNRVGLLTVTP